MRGVLCIAACALGALLAPAVASAAAPVVSAEYPASTPIIMSDPGGQGSAVVAWNPLKGKYLVLWVDGSVIRGQWMSPAGVLDAGAYAFTITPSGSPSALSIAAKGHFFLLAWTQNSDIWAVRILDDQVLGSPFLISAAAEAFPGGNAIQTSPTVASNGTDFLVAWEDGRRNNTDPAHSSGDGTDIYAARVSGNVFAGDLVLDDTGIQFTAGDRFDADGCGGADSCQTCTGSDQCRVSPSSRDAAAASDGANYFVAWATSSGASIQARPVASTGGTPGTTVTLPDTAGLTESTPDLIWNSAGSVYFAVWKTGSSGDINGARFNAAGTLLDTSPVDLVTGTADRRNPKVIALAATSYYVAWAEPGASGLDVYGANPRRIVFVTPPIWVAGTPKVVAAEAENQQFPVIAGGGTSPAVVWSDGRLGAANFDVYGGRVDADGDRLDGSGLLISRAANQQFDPEVAWNGAANLVLWNDRRVAPTDLSEHDLYRGRVSSSGAILDGAGSLALTGIQNGPPADVATDGTGFLAVWSRNFKVYAARLDASGAMVGTEIPIYVPAYNGTNPGPVVVWNGANYLIAWRYYDATNDQGIMAARVSPDGVLLDASPVVVTSGGNGMYTPDLASDGGNWLVSWSELVSGQGYRLFARRLDRAANPLGGRFAVSDAAAEPSSSRVAWDGDRYLVVWEDSRNNAAGTTFDIYGARVGGDGMLLDTTSIPIAVAPGARGGLEPAVAWNGGRFVVAWRTYGDEIRAARITGAGAILDSGGVVVTGNPLSPPALAPASPGRVTVAYERLAAGSQYGDVSRVFVKFFDDDVTPTADTTPPTNPTAVSSPSHTVGAVSRDNTIDVAWSGATDAGRGVGGYSYVWDTSPTTIPETAKNADADASSATSPPLADGTAHYFHLRTMDKAGNWSPDALHLGPFVIDATPPETTITAGPGGTANVAFQFTSSEEGSSFLCSLDAASAAPCTSPASYSGLAVGSHTFTVAATDAVGNTDPTPASASWVVAPPPGPAALPTIAISNAKVKEGNRGTKAMTFLVRLSAPSTQPVTVQFKTQKGTAKPKSDFLARAGTLTFAPGQTLLKLVIKIRGDRRDEKHEKFKVLLANALGATIADGEGVGTIRDND